MSHVYFWISNAFASVESIAALSHMWSHRANIYHATVGCIHNDMRVRLLVRHMVKCPVEQGPRLRSAGRNGGKTEVHASTFRFAGIDLIKSWAYGVGSAPESKYVTADMQQFSIA